MYESAEVLRGTLAKLTDHEKVKILCAYIDEAAGSESVLMPIGTLSAISRRAERAEAEVRRLRYDRDMWKLGRHRQETHGSA